MNAYIYNTRNNIIVGIANDVIKIDNDSIYYGANSIIKPISGKFNYVTTDDEITANVGDIFDLPTLCPLKFAEIKATKKKELSDACENAIVNGFTSNITGILLSYGYDLVDQQNWDSQYEAVQLAIAGNTYVIAQFAAIGYPEGEVVIKAKGDNDEYAFITYDQYISFWLEGKAWVTYNRMQKYFPLCKQLNNTTDINDINTIVWE